MTERTKNELELVVEELTARLLKQCQVDANGNISINARGAGAWDPCGPYLVTLSIEKTDED